MNHEVGKPVVCAKVVHRHEARRILAHADNVWGTVGKRLCTAAEQVQVSEVPSRTGKTPIQHRLDGTWGEEDQRASEHVEHHRLLDDRKRPRTIGATFARANASQSRSMSASGTLTVAVRALTSATRAQRKSASPRRAHSSTLPPGHAPNRGSCSPLRR